MEQRAPSSSLVWPSRDRGRLCQILRPTQEADGNVADTPDADTPPTPFQAHLRSKSDNRRQTERKRACSICRGAKEEKQSLKEPSTPAPILPRKRGSRTSRKPHLLYPPHKKSRCPSTSPHTSSHYFWLKPALLPHFQPKITLFYSSS